MNPTIPAPVHILQVPVHPVTMTQTVALAEAFMAGDTLRHIVTTNPEFVMAAHDDPSFMAVIQNAALSVPDGVGLLLAARRQGRRLPARVPGSELVYTLAEAAARHGWRLFLLGAAPGVAEEAARRLQSRYPALTIAGTYAGSPSAADNEALVARINASAADLLYVAYGAPRQDKWIARNRKALRTVRVALGVGGALDFITGRSRRAPRWLQRLGLEWFYRLLREPWRWRRMRALPRFAIAVLRRPAQSRDR